MRLTYIIKYRLKLFRKYTIVSLMMFFINIYNNSSKHSDSEKSSATVSVLLYSKNHFKETRVQTHSVFLPLISAIDTAEENRHRFVSGANLNFHEIRLFVPTLSTTLLNSSFLRTYKRIFSTEHIVHLFSVEMHLVFKGLLDHEYVGTGLAIEAEVCGSLLDEQQICACWTK